MGKKTRKVMIGNVAVGGGEPVRIQSMCSTDTARPQQTIKQIKKLESAGCEIIRVSVPDMKAVKALKSIKQSIAIPLVADIHFDYRLALAAVSQGVDKIRINPGTIGSKNAIKEIVSACREHHTAIRIGVNAGSLLFLKKSDTWRSMDPQTRAQHMVSEAMEYIELFESLNFYDLIISLKAADIPATLSAYRLISSKCDYPLHLGITEAGSLIPGIVKSSLGLGMLLAEGIGDTIRVSLTEDPVYEVKTGYEILRALHLRTYGPEIISCPTCARCKVDITSIVHKLERTIDTLHAKKVKIRPLKVAVMGCVVNGPGEAKDADVGIAGGKGAGILFKNGKQIKRIPEKQWINEIIKELKE